MRRWQHWKQRDKNTMRSRNARIWEERKKENGPQTVSKWGCLKPWKMVMVKWLNLQSCKRHSWLPYTLLRGSKVNWINHSTTFSLQSVVVYTYLDHKEKTHSFFFFSVDFFYSIYFLFTLQMISPFLAPHFPKFP